MRKFKLIVPAVLVLGLLFAHGAIAQQSPTDAPGTSIAAGQLSVADDAQLLPPLAQRSLPQLALGAKTGTAPAAGAASAGEEIPFRPTISDADYAAAKAAAASVAQAPKPGAASGPLAPPNFITGSAGADQSNNSFGARPSDTHIAAGGGAFPEVVQVGNSFIYVYDHAPTLLTAVSLNSFFGLPPPAVFNDILFDPRVVYDTNWNRWIVTAEAFAASPTVQLFWVAVSLTDDATGAFYRYTTNTTQNTNDFFDYPQLGIDQDSVLITANIFAPAPVNFRGARAFALAKARIYNGFGWSVPTFNGLAATLAPPIVAQQDQNPVTYFVAARPGGNSLQLYAMREGERPAATSMVLQANVPVAAYAVPPNAPQPGTTALVDTLDARFVNASTQIGNLLYQVHTVRLGSFAAPKWYLINTTLNTAPTQQFFFASGNSYDWNASIAANGNSEVFVNWTSDDPPAGIPPSLRIGGSQSNGFIDAGTQIDSGTLSTEGRWGDYSAVSLDPVARGACGPFRTVWLTNQLMVNPGFWTTDIIATSYC